MFYTEKKAKLTKSTAKKTSHHLLKIETSKVLLANKSRQDLIAKIKNLSALETERCQTLIIDLINNLVNHVQSLPETSNSYYSMPGGIIDYALNRTEASLEIFYEFIILEDDKKLSEVQKLWAYALLSASILKEIGRIYTDYEIDIYDNSEDFIKQYNPVLESLSAQGHLYSYQFNKANPEQTNLKRRLNILLAESLIPRTGFDWIASNPEVLAVWLALINEDPRDAGTLGAILIRADSVAIRRYIDNFIVKGIDGHGRSGKGHIGTFIDGKTDLHTKEQIVGAKFIQWLSKAITAGTIMINHPPLFMVPGGMLMGADIFKYFIREHPEFKNISEVEKGLLSLGLHETGADGTGVSRFKDLSSQKMITGINIAKFAVVLPETVKIGNLYNGDISKCMATELIHKSQYNNQYDSKQNATPNSPLSHLNTNGSWLAKTETAVSFLRPGTGHIA